MNLKSAALISIFCLICGSSFVSCTTQTRENFRLYKLNDPLKSLGILTSEYTQPIHLESVVREDYILPSTLLDNLRLSGTTTAEIRAGCGSLNEVFLVKNPEIQETNIEFPINGVAVILDSKAGFLLDPSIETLSEMFKFAGKSIKADQNFNVTSSISGENTAQIFAQEPSDSICSDNIDKLKKYLPCYGNKGVFAYIDKISLFKSSYVGITLRLRIESDKVFFTLTVISQFHSDQQNVIFRSKSPIEACPLVQTAFIQAGDETLEAVDQLTDQGVKSGRKYFSKLSAIEVINSKKNGETHESKKLRQMVKSERYTRQNWYHHSDAIIHSIENESKVSTIEFEVFEFLPYHFFPVYSQVQVLVNDRNLLENENRFNKTIFSHTTNSRKDVIIRVNIDLLPGEKMVIVIPVIKMMKSFQNYPHDPQRGHDIISSPLFFKEKGSKQTDMVLSNNLVAFLPEPDFSMPFKIITFVCVLMGYLFLQIFRIATEKASLGGHDDNILKKIFNLFKQN